MAYSGRYKPNNPAKYKGNPRNIIYRSLWERKLMVYCDTTSAIVEWGSEEFFIPYRSPVDNRVHRYFPDFYMKVRQGDGKTKKIIVEVKPKAQTKPPNSKPARRTKRWLNEVTTWAVNDAKWKAAREFCADRNMEFIIMTEDHLYPKHK